uniref:Glyco_hydro_38C domain-containing protein n=1 Tax=Angiostrongylus cantonensis TaxID=6313 RepID=A0A0K0D9M1_ANGCA
MKKVFVAGPKDLKILQVYSIWEGSPSVEIVNEVDIQCVVLYSEISFCNDVFMPSSGTVSIFRSKSNFELAMRLNTSFIRRRRMLNKLPLQAHFYPMPASAYIEDASTRLSLLGAQALGVASLKPGELEVMLDRRLNQDDGRGLDQGVLDNHRTLSRFRLLIEPLSSDKDSVHERVGFYSTLGLAQSMEIHYPVIRMHSKGNLE